MQDVLLKKERLENVVGILQNLGGKWKRRACAQEQYVTMGQIEVWKKRSSSEEGVVLGCGKSIKQRKEREALVEFEKKF